MSRHVSRNVNLESTRRRLTEKQADTVARLTQAAVEVLREEGFTGLTVRMVAARAGVAPATAYTYFSSKEHLVAEVFWRRLANAPTADAADAENTSRADRVVAVLRGIALLLADEPELAAAVTSALLGQDPDVEHLRARIGLDIRHRISAALGADSDPDELEALELLYAGALVRAGMGYGTYEKLADRLETSARLLLE
ncbi:transcriptional regulator, TetR family [Rhodococcus rhodochrous J3]|mgnify:CR=1 FL=1|uniref:Transcriptional regulator, TetR family n=1 Tax=Rhodococcus rhodochrous J3 TaxID=903528 RepID=A0ABY1MB15_RHORH|nr:TetR family transcriptional regulator [Rhodococcus rhodochrous J38]SMG38691.1 transcriptional regulator, TetR family [Rhodococcus rhodochrous J3]SNV12743.1 TetR family transcriptional regulator [Rhodococcus rhodochrous]